MADQAERARSSRSPSPTLRFDELSVTRRLLQNPTACYAFGFPRRIDFSALPAFRGRQIRPRAESAQSLRDQQQAGLAETQIRRAGQFLREGLNFEAIQCCNNALKMDPGSVDALLGRSIA